MGDSESPAAKRAKQSQQNASGSCLEAGERLGTSMPCKDDVAHFEGLDPTFASTVNLVLSVQDKDHTVKFPVHKDVILGHSPMLCQVIKELPLGSTETPQLPMIGDSCSALRNVLACMYEPFHSSRPAANTRVISLAEWPIHVSNLYLAHKYNMLGILRAQEDALIPPLTDLVNGVHTDERGSVVLAIAVVTKACGCKRMLANCEAFVVKQFDAYAISQHQEVLRKLSPASLFRVSQGLIHGHKTAMSIADDALVATASEAIICSSKLSQGDTCPRCGRPVYIRFNPPPQRVEHRDCTSNCRWPKKQPLTTSTTEASSTAMYLADLAAKQDWQ